jgi:basic amino acid/polyamine antiporter, APA family
LILTYILSIFSVIILRKSRIQNYRPGFRAPLFPWLQILGIIGFIFILTEMGRNAIIISAALVAAGILIYVFYGRRKAKGKDHALLYILDGITPKRLSLTSGELEKELKMIIYERDNIVKDDFHRAILESTVLDIDDDIDIFQLYREVSGILSKKLDMEPEYLYAKFEKREKESSPVIAKNIIIPNIIIDGEGYFKIFVVRCKKGIRFREKGSEIFAAFFLVSSRDRRNLMLRAHTCISQIIAKTGLLEMWMRAKGEKALKDIILLGERKRD